MQGNTIPKLPFDCGFGTSSFLAGKRTGLPAAGDTLAYSCGLWLDQVWMPQSFATGIGANWCRVPIDPVVAGNGWTYTFRDGCNFEKLGDALQDPEKKATILNVNSDSGSCFRVNDYTWVCPQDRGETGTLRATFAAPLAEGFEFGYGVSTDGRTIKTYFPARVIDEDKAAAIITELAKEYGDVDPAFKLASAFILAGKYGEACRVLDRLATLQITQTDPVGSAEKTAAAVLKALDCNTR